MSIKWILNYSKLLVFLLRAYQVNDSMKRMVNSITKDNVTRTITHTHVTNVNSKSTATISSSWCSKGNIIITDALLAINVGNHLQVARNSKWCLVVGIVVYVDRRMGFDKSFLIYGVIFILLWSLNIKANDFT